MGRCRGWNMPGSFCGKGMRNDAALPFAIKAAPSAPVPSRNGLGTRSIELRFGIPGRSFAPAKRSAVDTIGIDPHHGFSPRSASYNAVSKDFTCYPWKKPQLSPDIANPRRIHP